MELDDTTDLYSDLGEQMDEYELLDNSSQKRQKFKEEELSINPWTDQPYSDHYYELLEERKELTVLKVREGLISLIKCNKIVLLKGETGNGKTTQVPQFLLESGLAKGKCIACTQPTSDAAVSASQRVSEEMDLILGDEVGYSIRFEDKSSAKTKIKYMTDEMLISEAVIDPSLNKYSIIIIDEVQERTLSTDTIFVILKRLLKVREDLKLVVMGVTMDSAKFQNYLEGPPLLDIPGRMHPVDIYYTEEPEEDYVVEAVKAVLQIHTFEEEGDILLFLVKEEEVEKA